MKIVVHKQEWSGGGTDHGMLEVSLDYPRKLDEVDQTAIYALARQLLQALDRRTEVVDPIRIDYKARWIAEAKALFNSVDLIHIWIDEMPNEYDPDRLSSPWLMVTTTIGHFKIGWRKRVLVLDWHKTTCLATADTLFRKEDVTKGERMIHCWNYEKATQYLKIILANTNAPK